VVGFECIHLRQQRGECPRHAGRIRHLPSNATLGHGTCVDQRHGIGLDKAICGLAGGRHLAGDPRRHGTQRFLRAADGRIQRFGTGLQQAKRRRFAGLFDVFLDVHRSLRLPPAANARYRAKTGL